jgi:hypothetical protein
LLWTTRQDCFRLKKDTITVEEHNQEMLKTMEEFAEVLELSILRERDACAKVALDLKSDEIAKAIRERVPAQSTSVH